MKPLFDKVSTTCSKITTQQYSTSFSLGILFLGKSIRNDIYSIYGFVRFADEIVDSFHDYDKKYLLTKFKTDTYEAIIQGISLNPILNSFQEVVNKYDIDHTLIDQFLYSMEMDLEQSSHDASSYETYILGSAEVVGLMCLTVFCRGNKSLYNELKPFAMKLGAAFQKVNFLRDAKADSQGLGRIYFPNVDITNFTMEDKEAIEHDIANDFALALQGIKKLPPSSRKGVYLAYYYYNVLFKKIKNTPPQKILSERIRIPNGEKFYLMLKSNLRIQLNLL